MKNNLSKNKMRQALAQTMQYPSDLRQMLLNNGIANAESLNDYDTQIATLKAVKDSASFRSDLANFMTEMVKSSTKKGVASNFVSQGDLGFVAQQRSLNFGALDTPLSNTVSLGGSSSSGAAAAGGSTSTSNGGGDFWSALGGLATTQNLQSLFNTGLGAVSSSLQSKANSQSEAAALALEQTKLQELQTQQQLNAAGVGGLSTGAWIGIGAGVLVLTIILVVALRKK